MERLAQSNRKQWSRNLNPAFLTLKQIFLHYSTLLPEMQSQHFLSKHLPFSAKSWFPGKDCKPHLIFSSGDTEVWVQSSNNRDGIHVSRAILLKGFSLNPLFDKSIWPAKERMENEEPHGVGCTVEQGEESVDYRPCWGGRQKGSRERSHTDITRNGIINSVNARNEWMTGSDKRRNPESLLTLEMIPKEVGIISTGLLAMGL